MDSRLRGNDEEGGTGPRNGGEGVGMAHMRRETFAKLDSSVIAAHRRGNLAVWATTVQITARYPRQARV